MKVTRTEQPNKRILQFSPEEIFVLAACAEHSFEHKYQMMAKADGIIATLQRHSSIEVGVEEIDSFCRVLREGDLYERFARLLVELDESAKAIEAEVEAVLAVQEPDFQ
jgi:hypothetical protein